MKPILSILGLLLVFCGCVSAEPPDHRPAVAPITNAVMTVVAPVGVPVDGIIGYGANHADTNWTRVTYLPTTNGQYMTVHVPVYELYTATSTNSQTGQESDYAAKFAFNTNGVVMMVPNVTVSK